jgi:hypothetical protein
MSEVAAFQEVSRARLATGLVELEDNIHCIKTTFTTQGLTA